MHIHKWVHRENDRRWLCKGCGEAVTYTEFDKEYGQWVDYDILPIPELNRLSSYRKGKASVYDFRK